MKTKLERLIEKVVDLRDSAHDDEVTDELDNALLHLEAASDQLVAMEEEDEDTLDPIARDAAIEFADELLAVLHQRSCDNCGEPLTDPDEILCPDCKP